MCGCKGWLGMNLEELLKEKFSGFGEISDSGTFVITSLRNHCLSSEARKLAYIIKNMSKIIIGKD